MAAKNIEKWFKENGASWDCSDDKCYVATVYPAQESEVAVDPISISVYCVAGDEGWWISTSDNSFPAFHKTLIKALDRAEILRKMMESEWYAKIPKKQDADIPVAAQEYTLDIDGPELAKQRLLLCKAITLANDTDDRELAEALEGIQALLDEIADQGHDNYGLATLNDEGEGEF